MDLDDFDYDLPSDRIAQHPPAERDGGKLLLLDRETGDVAHHRIVDLPELLPRRCVIVTNDTRVFPARLEARRATGGRVELLLLERLDDRGHSARWRCMLRSSKRLSPGEELVVDSRPEEAGVHECW